MYQIRKEHHFSASHFLENVPDGHPCGKLHGHNYVVEVILQSRNGDLTEEGWVQDYNELTPIFDYIDGVLDHAHLNEVLEGRTTAEEIARHLYERFEDEYPQMTAIRVSETRKTWATYAPNRPPHFPPSNVQQDAKTSHAAEQSGSQ